jgi:hypothetical protein
MAIYITTKLSMLSGLTATYFFFSKKHIPILFHREMDSGKNWAAILYLERATSKSW